MDKLRTGVFVLFVLPEPASCTASSFFSHPVVCYFLDGFLLIYCIAATAMYFKEKFSFEPSVPAEASQEENGGIYQELDIQMDADPYQVLEPSKRKKKAGKKKKPQLALPEDRDKDPYESLMPSGPPPPLSPH